MAEYSVPSVVDLGSLHGLTLVTINKSPGASDVIFNNGVEETGQPGSTVIGVS
jgi:hypothetical protein